MAWNNEVSSSSRTACLILRGNPPNLFLVQHDLRKYAYSRTATLYFAVIVDSRIWVLIKQYSRCTKQSVCGRNTVCNPLLAITQRLPQKSSFAPTHNTLLSYTKKAFAFSTRSLLGLSLSLRCLQIDNNIPRSEIFLDHSVRKHFYPFSHCIGFAWPSFGGCGATGMASLRSCQKLF